jgi:hypothetical protein
MLEQLINFAHVAPLMAILLLVAAPKVRELFFGAKIEANKSNSLVLILASVGILAGAVDHNHVEYVIDPCFGYALALVHVAFKLMLPRTSTNSIAK